MVKQPSIRLDKMRTQDISHSFTALQERVMLRWAVTDGCRGASNPAHFR